MTIAIMHSAFDKVTHSNITLNAFRAVNFPELNLTKKHPMEQLPEEVILHILSFVDAVDVVNFQRISRTLR